MNRAMAAVIVILATACGSATSHGALGKRVAAARSFQEYPLYWLGMSYGKLRLDTIGDPERVDVLNASHTAIVRTHSHTVTFDYGPCVGSSSGDEAGCTWPLEVQNWPACGRNAALYRLPLPLPDRIRGVPAKRFGDGVEIWTWTTDVVIFGRHAARVARAIESANRLAGHVEPGEPLPAPAPGALEGKLKCTR